MMLMLLLMMMIMVVIIIIITITIITNIAITIIIILMMGERYLRTDNLYVNILFFNCINFTHLLSKKRSIITN